MSFRNTASFGKRYEFIIISELLKRNFDVYLTLVDDMGIDCIIRKDDNIYIDIQIKARSKSAKYFTFFSAMNIIPRDNYFFIFYTEINDSYWVIPSKDVIELGNMNKSGANKDKISLRLPLSNTSKNYKKFEKFHNENGFNLLKEFR